MKKLLQKLLATPTRAKDSSKILAQAYEESHYASLWEDTGEIIYLMDTLKLCYESERGLVTFERLKRDDVHAILADIADGKLAPMRQKVTAGQTAEIRISISGLSCQKMGDKTRSKAIPEAAILRCTTPTFSYSQALFKHADLIAAHDSTLLALPNQANVFTYNRISPQDFLSQIEKLNARFVPANNQRITMNRENYDAPFSDNEERVLALAQSELKRIQDQKE